MRLCGAAMVTRTRPVVCMGASLAANGARTRVLAGSCRQAGKAGPAAYPVAVVIAGRAVLDNMAMNVGPGGAVADLRPLAEGPVATVYTATMRAGGPAAGTEVAIKVYAEALDRETSVWLTRERRALERVRDLRAILPIQGVVEHPDGRPGVLMELCRESLASRLGTRGAPQPIADVLTIGTALASALTAAHRVGVVHGGVTPHNVLFRTSGEVALADFGLALRERFPRDPQHAVEFTAPETLRDDTRTESSDLYGLGAVLCLAATGAPPFPHRAGESPDERILRVLREPAPTLRDVPAEFADLVARLLAKDPAARPKDAASVARSLERLSDFLVGPMPAKAPPTSIPLSQGADRPVEAAPIVDVPAVDVPAVDVPVADVSVVDAPAGDAVERGGNEFDFDDFPAADDAYAVRRSPHVAAPARTLVMSARAEEPARRPWRRGALIGTGVVALVGLSILPIVLIGQSSPEPAAPTPVRTAPPAVAPAEIPPELAIELEPPVDQGTHVQLTWRADGDLDFGVVVAGERIDTMVLVANRKRTMRVPVDPVRRYCFQVRGTDGRNFRISAPQPIRGAQCKL